MGHTVAALPIAATDGSAGVRREGSPLAEPAKEHHGPREAGRRLLRQCAWQESNLRDVPASLRGGLEWSPAQKQRRPEGTGLLDVMVGSRYLLLLIGIPMQECAASAPPPMDLT